MDRIDLFPDPTQLSTNGISIGGCDLAALAKEYGTPLYLYDQQTLDTTVNIYRDALVKNYHGKSGITYAGKAFLCLAMAQWTQKRDLWMDCTGAGEIAIAVAGGVQPAHLLVHGVNKSLEDLQAACIHAGTIVVDHLSELEQLLTLETRLPELWLRFQPGVEVDTHSHIQTGQSGSKFGMEREEILEAARMCRNAKQPLKGLHFHLGSQMGETGPLVEAIARCLDLAARIDFEEPWILSPGGGWGVAYNDAQLPQPSTESYVRALAEAVESGCRTRSLPLPILQLEPGRSLTARAGVALYRVGAVKPMQGRTWVLLDGGLADNPRHALYGVDYSALVVGRPTAPVEASVCLAGPYCESGDVLSMDLPLPKVEAGDLLAVPVSGAYQLSMASHYNGARLPAVVWLKDSHAKLIQERESPADLIRRDHLLDE